MDLRRFDAIAKSLASDVTRHRVVRGVAAGALGALLGRDQGGNVRAADECRPPGARCRRNSQCCAKVCLDNGLCGCASVAAGTQVPCPAGCRCDQMAPGGIFACVEVIASIDNGQCCASLPRCRSSKDCGRSSFCDAVACNQANAVCVRRCRA